MIPDRFLLLFVCTLLAPLDAPAQAPVAAEVDRRLALIDAELAMAFEDGVNKAFNEHVRSLDVKYFRAIERVLESATKAGKLEDALAIREEKDRFSEASGVPERDAATDPAELTQLRATYRTQLGKLEADRRLAAAPLLAEHDAKLEAYQTLLTTEGKLDEALKVKNARENVTAKLSLSSATASPGTPATASGESEKGWNVVFDGNDLKLWKPRSSSRNFQITDRAFAARIVTDSPDYLFFKGSGDVPQILKNFELKATIKADPEANSGFYFHLDGDDIEKHPASGIEVSLHKGAKPMKYPTGSIYNVTEMAPSSVNQAEWFELHFKVVDQNITVWINGEVYLEHVASLSSGPGTKGILSDGGKLAIQANSKDGAYYFQNISIKPLD